MASRISRKRIQRGILWLVIIALCLAGATAFHALRILKKNNQKASVWLDAPFPAKALSIALEAERVMHQLLTPKPVPERYSHITSERLEQAMRRGADWLLRMQEPDGRFQYWYDPEADQFSHFSDDNFLRQAGTAFALTQAYKTTGELRYLQAARHNLNYLLRYKQELDEETSYFLFRRKAKLGGVALPMLAMLSIRQLTGTSQYDDELARLARMIGYLQDQYGTGQFKSTYVYRGDYEYEKTSGWESQMYPGEAMLALAEMYRAFGDEEHRRRMDWALSYYSRARRWKRHAFLPWSIQAFASMYAQTEDPRYAEYAVRLTDFLLTQQNLNAWRTVYGSFHGLPTVNTGSYMEALTDAIQLVRRIGDEQREQHYVARAKTAFLWLLQLQIGEEEAANLSQPNAALGGFRKNLYEPRLRIDNTQHSIAALAKALRALREDTAEPASEQL